jgi:hypothetical protein
MISRICTEQQYKLQSAKLHAGEWDDSPTLDTVDRFSISKRETWVQIGQNYWATSPRLLGRPILNLAFRLCKNRRVVAGLALPLQLPDYSRLPMAQDI